MYVRAVRRGILTLGTLIVSCAATGDSAVNSEARWREFFGAREFGEDPYFFFPQGETGPTGCPALQRLSFAGADSVGVRLTVIDERGANPSIRAECTARYAELRGNPEVRTLPDGRAMWALLAGGGRAGVPPTK